MKWTVVLVLCFLFGIVCAVWLVPFIQIDTCLDAGGAWDYEAAKCAYGPNGPS